MVVIKIGDGCGNSRTCDLGPKEGNITEEMLDMTFRQYAEHLANQAKVIDGEITLFSVNLHRAVSKSRE